MFYDSTDADRYGMHPRDIFICYGGADVAKAEKIARQLEGDYGWTCWYAERDIPINSNNDLEITVEMAEKCSVFLLLSSDGNICDNNTQIVASYAMALGKKRIELKIEDVHDRAVDVLNYQLHRMVSKKRASYKDSASVDKGIGVAGKIGAKALILLLVAVIGGFVAVRAFDTARSPQAPLSGIAHLPPRYISAPLSGYETEINIEVTTPTEFMLAMALAGEGDINAKYRLGNMYLDMRNVELGFYWLKKAASARHLAANLTLGVMYWDERNYFHDRIEAFGWLYNAAELGHAGAQNWVAGFYRIGIEFIEPYSNSDGAIVAGQFRSLEIPQDYEAAMYWYRKAAMQGHSSAQTTLGVMYIQGQGVNVNPEQAVYWYRRAANQGNSVAQGNLGISYVHGQGVYQCYQQAAYWFRKSSEQNNVSAQVNLAWMYENGHNGYPNLDASFYWNHRAALLGSTYGQNNIGLMFMQGRGVNQCYDQAAYWFGLAAARDCERGIAYLALIYVYEQENMPDYEQSATED